MGTRAGLGGGRAPCHVGDAFFFHVGAAEFFRSIAIITRDTFDPRVAASPIPCRGVVQAGLADDERFRCAVQRVVNNEKFG